MDNLKLYMLLWEVAQWKESFCSGPGVSKQEIDKFSDNYPYRYEYRRVDDDLFLTHRLRVPEEGGMPLLYNCFLPSLAMRGDSDNLYVPWPEQFWEWLPRLYGAINSIGISPNEMKLQVGGIDVDVNTIIDPPWCFDDNMQALKNIPYSTTSHPKVVYNSNGHDGVSFMSPASKNGIEFYNKQL